MNHMWYTARIRKSKWSGQEVHCGSRRMSRGVVRIRKHHVSVQEMGRSRRGRRECCMHWKGCMGVCRWTLQSEHKHAGEIVWIKETYPSNLQPNPIWTKKVDFLQLKDVLIFIRKINVWPSCQVDCRIEIISNLQTNNLLI